MLTSAELKSIRGLLREAKLETVQVIVSHNSKDKEDGNDFWIVCRVKTIAVPRAKRNRACVVCASACARRRTYEVRKRRVAQLLVLACYHGK
jgi:hypothetical protein